MDANMTQFLLDTQSIRAEMSRLMEVSIRDVTLRFMQDDFAIGGELVIGVGVLYNSIRPFELKYFTMDLPQFSERFLVPAMHNLKRMKER